ncbi:MAG: hypothetical protein DRG30_07110 [Epsilonproteobacteria bacterium]|nr:MAG: hypothetical protein DRG30_07110 [Campylobacterota bacterium]
MEKLTVINDLNIENRIFTLRGMQVMLDRDLADIYGIKSIRLREQTKRNIDRFPDDFMFQLTNNEVDFMVSQNVIPSRQHLGASLKDLGKKWFAFSKFDVGVFEMLGRLK